MADSPFVWGAGGEQLTPEQLASRRRIAEAMMAQGMDSSPIRSPWQGLDRVAKSLFGAYQGRQADDEAASARQAAIAAVMKAYNGGEPGGMPVAAASPPAGLPAVAGAAQPAAPADTSGKIYSNDEPSPLDPPSGEDRVRMAKTILGEAANEPAAGQNAVASVIRTRAVDGGYGGDTPSGVVTAKNQFEPWNTAEGQARMDRAYADPTQRAAAEAAIAAAYGEGGRAPNDPTEGMTHFYSPTGQAALGRSAPAWAGGESVTIGGHVFNSPDDKLPAAAVPVQGTGTPPGVPAVSPAVATVAAAMPQGGGATSPGRPGVAQLMSAMSNPFLPPAFQQLAAAQLSKSMQPQHVQEKDAAGNVWDIGPNNERKVALKADKDTTPSSVLEYEYYRKNFRPTEQAQAPMPYDTWATAKARAGAISVGNVTTNAGGGSDKQIFDEFAERSKEARSAATGLVALRNARSALDAAGGAITGAGADTKLLLSKAGAAFGITDPKAAENTETFRAAIAPQVAAMLKSTVGTTNISNSDREFAEKAAGGSIALEGNSIKRLLDIMERASVARLQLHQEQLDAVYPDPAMHKRERALFGVKVPAADAPPPPAGATKTGVKWSVE